MNDPYTFPDLLQDAWRHAGKYIGISVCTVVVYFICILILGSIIPPSGDLLTGLVVTLAVTN